MSGFAADVLEGAVLEVETTLLPRMTFELSSAVDDSGPGPITQVLKPRYTIRRGNLVLLARAPAGSPDGARQTVMLGALVVVVLLGLWLVNR